MELNITSVPDFNLLNQEELQQEYMKLFNKYTDLKTLNDGSNQQIYELKRNLQTATAAESYLSQELELALSTQSHEIEKINRKYFQEFQELKNKYTACMLLKQTLEENCDDLKNENESLKHKVSQLDAQKPLELPITVQTSKKELKLEEENIQLFEKIDQLQVKINETTILMAQKERKIEMLKEQVHCLEENLQSKRDELEEKSNLLECTQERLIEMNTELSALKSQPDNENRKGNSLFAEVDDQRQAMKRQLAAQKKSYLHMKKVFNEVEHEVRRLKRENAEMHKELQACTSIFLSAEKMYKEKLNERNAQLLKQLKELEKRLIWTEEKLVEISKNKGFNWLDSMLTYCRNETKELKSQLHSCRMQKGTLENNLYNSQQELAKWRFESLRSRCIIINRENLLEENGIHFECFTFSDFNISEKQCEEATPRIIVEEGNKSFESKIDSNGSLDSRRIIKKEGDLNLGNTIQKNVDEDFNVSVRLIEINSTSSQVDEIQCKTQQELQENLKKENINEFHKEKIKLKTEVKDDGAFSIYEDTEQFLPIVTCSQDTRDNPFKDELYFDLSISEETFQNLMERGEENSAFIPSSNDIENNPKAKGNMLPPETNFFQVYEDTTQNLPVKKVHENENKFRFEGGILPPENKENYNTVNYTSQAKEEFPSKINSISENSGILIKNRNFVVDEVDSKSVKFNLHVINHSEDKNKQNIKAYVKQTRTKSNVVIKRIMVQSKNTDQE